MTNSIHAANTDVSATAMLVQQATTGSSSTGPRVRSTPPSHGRSPPLWLRFTSLRMGSLWRDLHAQDSAHAGRTKMEALGRVRPRPP